MFIVEFDRDQVFVGFSYDIFNIIRFVFTIIKVQFGFRGIFYSNRQIFGFSFFGVDVEFIYICKGFFSVQLKLK